VSHPGSWGGGGTSIDQPGDCSDDDLNHDDCIYERIKGNPTYKSPIESNCQSNFIILLTDGIANHNHSEDAIRTYTGEATCAGGNGEQACGHELVKYLHDEDQSPVAGMQNVITYTIGFNFSSKWLVEMAALGGGKFHEAKDADQLVREVTNIFTDILNRSTSFAAPTLSVNAFNKLFHRSDVYFSLFKPSASVRWEGNLKKYQLCPSTGSDSTLWPKDKSGTPKACADLGEVLDAEADPAVVKDPLNPDLGRIEDTAESFWGGVQDGSEIKVGGAGLEIPAPANRRVLTYTSTAAPSFSALDNVTHTVASAGGGDQGILKGLSGTKAEREKRTQVLFGDLAFASTPDDREEIIDWMIGTDIDGLEDVASLASAGRRFAFHDPLHDQVVRRYQRRRPASGQRHQRCRGVDLLSPGDTGQAEGAARQLCGHAHLRTGRNAVGVDERSQRQRHHRGRQRPRQQRLHRGGRG
jgi:type IV pilus assembly protein PilY1